MTTVSRRVVPEDSARDAAFARRASVVELDEIANELDRAFADYSLCQWLLAKTGNPASARLRLARLLLSKIGFPHGAVYRPPDGGAVAVWIDSERLCSLGLTDAAEFLVRVALGSIATAVRLVATHRAMRKHAPKGSYIHFYLLGVVPRLQNQGLGAGLMRAGLALADMRAKPVFLETSDEKNIDLYRRYGFEVTDVYDIANGAPPTWTMWRAARPGELQ